MTSGSPGQTQDSPDLDAANPRRPAVRATRVRVRYAETDRMGFDYDLVRASDGTLSAVGYSIHAALDAAGRPCRLPARVRDILG